MLNKMSIRTKLLLLSFIPIVALLIVLINVYIETKQASDIIHEIAVTGREQLISSTQQASVVNEQFIEKLLQSDSVVEELEEVTLMSSWIFIVITIIAALLINLVISRRVTRSLDEAVNVAKRISAGERHIPIVAATEDETGQLLKNMDVMQKSIQEVEDALRKSQERFDLAVRGSESGIWDWNIETDTVYYSPRISFLLGYLEEEFSASTTIFLTHVYPEDRPVIKAALINHFKDHRPFDIDIRIRTKSGEYRWFHIKAQAIWNEQGRAVRIAGSMSDISERMETLMKLEQQQLDLIRLSKTDALTGVYNRRHLMEHIDQEIERAQRYGTLLSIMMLDLDHFKTINDVYGHPKGDQVLKIVSKILRHNARSSDLVFRYGGEEFSILLPETSLQAALDVAERFRSIIEEAHIPIDKNQRIDFTCSIGLACYHSDVRNAETFIAVADKALYRAKKNGRNRIEVAADYCEHTHDLPA